MGCQTSSTRHHDSTTDVMSDDALESQAWNLLDEGNEALKRGDARGALQKFTVMREKGQAMQNQRLALPVEGAALGSLGNAYQNLGQYKEAVESLTSALEISRGIGNRQREGNRLGNLGNSYWSLGQYDKAIKKYTAALVISQEIGDRRGEGQQLGNLGNAYKSLGQYDKAIEMQTAALAISQEIGDRGGEGKNLANLGLAYNSLGQYDRAIEMHTAALVISREIGDRRLEGDSLGNLGSAYRCLGQYNKAMENHTATLVIRREIGDRRGEGNSLGSLGNCYGQLGENQKAILYHKDALAITCEIGDRQWENGCLYNLALCHFDLEEYDKAKELLEKSIMVSNAIWSDLRRDEDRITYDDGGMQKASRLLQEVYSKLGQQEEAFECAERARSRAFELLLVQQRVQGGTTSGESPASPPSVEALDISLIRELAVRQRSAIVTFSQVSDETILVWVVGSDTTKQLFSTSIEMGNKENSPSELSQQLSQLVETTRRSLRAPARQGSNVGPGPAQDKGSLTLPTVDEEILYGTTATMALLPNGSTPSSEQMRSAFAPAVHGSAQRDGGDSESSQSDALQETSSKKLLRQFYELLITPLESSLEGEEELIIIPDRDLYALPFTALLDDKGRHLIEKFKIRIAPSVGTLVELEKRVEERDISRREASHGLSTSTVSALIVGNPDFNMWQDQLFGSRLEAIRVKHTLERNACITTLLKDADATKERVEEEMRSSDIVHLATHGSKDGIFLSAKTLEEGKLSMGEVQGLTLERARLVVLSACDTFKGELRADGVIGITRAFVIAGAPTLMSTLWTVGDDSTYVMMRWFYRRLFSSEADRVDGGLAFRDVLISMINDGFKVQEWAPFVLFGLSTSIGFEPFASSTKSPIQVDMEYLLDMAELLSEPLLDKAINWCEEQGISRAVDIETAHEEDFANSFELKRVKRKRLLVNLRKMREDREGFC